MRLLTLFIVCLTVFCLWETKKTVNTTYKTLETYLNGNLIQTEHSEYIVKEDGYTLTVNDGKVVEYDSKMAHGDKGLSYFRGDSMVAKFVYPDKLLISDGKELYIFNRN